MKTTPGRLGIALCLSAAALLAGCATDSSVQIRSVHSPFVDAPILPHAVYSWVDANTANIYLTDLPAPALDPGTPLEGVSGRIVHLHMFLLPEAGSTPIESSACSISVRHIVIAGGQIGVYAGGGFFKPDSLTRSDDLRGRIRGATLRLTASTSNFADRLGPAVMDASISARRDEASAKRIAQRVEDLLRIAAPAQDLQQGSR